MNHKIEILEPTHSVKVQKVETESSTEKVMLVTPSIVIRTTLPFDKLSEGLTLNHIHNFTYEGFNIVDLYKELLEKKVKIEV